MRTSSSPQTCIPLFRKPEEETQTPSGESSLLATSLEFLCTPSHLHHRMDLLSTGSTERDGFTEPYLGSTERSNLALLPLALCTQTRKGLKTHTGNTEGWSASGVFHREGFAESRKTERTHTGSRGLTHTFG